MNQSTVKISPTWLASMLIPFKISTIVTKPPEGIPVTVNYAIKLRNLFVQTNNILMFINETLIAYFIFTL
jgi:hypothetical protein